MKTTMQQVATMIGAIAKLDRRGKEIIRDFLNDELSEKKPATGKTSKVRPIAAGTVGEKGGGGA